MESVQPLQPLVVLLAWYVPGFLAARSMARRGHDPLPWIYAAWIGGALAAVAAAVWVHLSEPPALEADTAPSPSIPSRTP